MRISNVHSLLFDLRSLSANSGVDVELSQGISVAASIRLLLIKVDVQLSTNNSIVFPKFSDIGIRDFWVFG